ncbi:twin-arginine translocation signal domain-containing protein [Haloplanus sp. GCM10025708]
MTTDRHTDERVASTNRSRREFLKTASLGVLAGGFAGCLGA